MNTPALETSPLRLLILSPTDPIPKSKPPPFVPLLQALTGTKPPPGQTSFCGYTQHQPLRLRTKYYTADVGIWCDEVPLPGIGDHLEPETLGENGQPQPQGHGTDVQDGAPTLSSWREQMLSSTAKEVRAAIGGIVILLPLWSMKSSESTSDAQMEVIDAINELRDMVEDENYNHEVATVVLLHADNAQASELDVLTEKLEESLLQDRGVLGWEIVGWDGSFGSSDEMATGLETARNAYGEKEGVARVVEVLEAVNWTASGGLEGRDDERVIGNLDLGFLSSEDDEEEEGDDEKQDHKIEGQRMDRKGLSEKLLRASHQYDGDGDEDGNEDRQIEQLPGLIERAMAIREAGTEMTPQQRQQFAKREIGKMLKDMG